MIDVRGFVPSGWTASPPRRLRHSFDRPDGLGNRLAPRRGVSSPTAFRTATAPPRWRCRDTAGFTEQAL